MHLTYKAPIDLGLPIRFPPFQWLGAACNLLKLGWNWFHSRIPLLISHFMMPSSPISVIALKASKMCLCELLYGGLCGESVSRDMGRTFLGRSVTFLAAHANKSVDKSQNCDPSQWTGLPAYVGTIKETKYVLCRYQPALLYRVAHGIKLAAKTGKLSR